MFPRVGDIVIAHGPPVASNGTDQAPAIVTRVWSQHCVNLTAFPDGTPAPKAFTSVTFSEIVGENDPTAKPDPNVHWDFKEDR